MAIVTQLTPKEMAKRLREALKAGKMCQYAYKQVLAINERWYWLVSGDKFRIDSYGDLEVIPFGEVAGEGIWPDRSRIAGEEFEVQEAAK